MNFQTKSLNMKIIGPIAICLGAFFWATDFPVRAQLVSAFGSTVQDAVQLAMFEHVLAIIIFLGILVIYALAFPKKREQLDYKKFFTLNKLEVFSMLWIGIAGSAMGIVFFNLAFGQAAVLQSMGIYSGYDQTLFVQKIQPVIAIALAAYLLRERLPRGFYLLAGIAIIGFLFLTFGTNTFPYIAINLNSVSTLIVLYSFLAALCWGSSTVFGRILVKKLDHTLTTLSRYVVGGIFLIFLNIGIGTNFVTAFTTALNAFWFLLYAAVISGGLLGLYIYYFGLKWTKASIATICELTYPIAGVVLNYYFLNSSMFPVQWMGALIILFAITIMAYMNASTPEPLFEDEFLNKKKESAIT